MTQWSEHPPRARRHSLHWEEGTTVICSPPGFQSWVTERTKLEGQEKKSLRSSSTTYTKPIWVCTGPRIYSSVNKDNNYTQCSQDQKKRVTEGRRQRPRQSLNQWERTTWMQKYPSVPFLLESSRNKNHYTNLSLCPSSSLQGQGLPEVPNQVNFQRLMC